MHFWGFGVPGLCRGDRAIANRDHGILGFGLFCKHGIPKFSNDSCFARIRQGGQVDGNLGHLQ